MKSKERTRWRLSNRVLNILSVLLGLITLGAGVGWLIYSWYVDLAVPYAAIPLVLCVPVIVAVGFRNCWD
jgi:hypothetical protein